MRASFLGCCASATAPHNANVTTMAKNPTNFGFWILRHGSGQVLDFRLKEKESRIRTEDFSFIPFISSNPKSAIQNLIVVYQKLNDEVAIEFCVINHQDFFVSSYVYLFRFGSVPFSIFD